MKAKNSFILFLVFFLNYNNLFAQNNDQYKFVLDYNVPQSPAFTVLGVNTNKVLGGSASKPVLINLLNQFLLGEKIEPGLAIDFSPFIFGIRLDSIQDYTKNYFQRLLINSSISIGTVKNNVDTNSLDLGIGFRFNLWDSFDPFSDAKTRNDIEKVLVSSIQDPEATIPGKPGETKKVKVVGLKEAYNKAKEELEKRTGFALSVGYGFKGTLKGSIINKDSLDINTHSAWIGATSYVKNINLMYSYQGTYLSKGTPKNIMGFGVKTRNPFLNVGGELFYDFKEKNFGGGLQAEVSILTGFSAIVSMNIESTEINNEKYSKMKLKTDLRWNLGN